MGVGARLATLAHNRKVQLAAGGVAGLAGWVWLRHRRATSSSSTSSTPPPGAGAPAFAGQAWPDTSGTDVASWLGNYSGALQSQLDSWGQQVTGALPAPPGTSTPSSPSSPTPSSGPVYSGAPVSPGSSPLRPVPTFNTFGG